MMEITKIPYDQTNSFSKHLIDYLANDKKLKPFVNHFPSFDAFEQQITEKQKHSINRSVLVKVLKKQNAIAENRKIMGATNPQEADQGTIRKEFGISIDKNSVHGSDSKENAEKEINFFFKD